MGQINAVLNKNPNTNMEYYKFEAAYQMLENLILLTEGIGGRTNGFYPGHSLREAKEWFLCDLLNGMGRNTYHRLIEGETPLIVRSDFKILTKTSEGGIEYEEYVDYTYTILHPWGMKKEYLWAQVLKKWGHEKQTYYVNDLTEEEIQEIEKKLKEGFFSTNAWTMIEEIREFKNTKIFKSLE
jgi:hypothetical protein